MEQDYPERAILTEAIQAARERVASAAEPDRRYELGALGTALTLQYEATGDAAVLDEAIGVLSTVVTQDAWTPAMTTDYRINLGVALEARAKETGSAADADAAVALARAALADSPDGTVDHLVIRSNLGNALLTRYEIAGGDDHVAEAVAHMRSVAAAFPESDLRRASMFANLSDALQLAFDQDGEMAHLIESVDAARAGVRLAEADDPGRPGYLLNLANGLLALAEASGDPALLDEAVAHAHHAVAAEASAPLPAQRGLLLSCLGNCLRRRYEMTGELAALDEAISADRAALAATSRQDPRRPGCLSNLAISLTLRHEHTPDLDMLKMALDHARSAVGAVGEDDPYRYLYQLTLGRTEYILFLATGEPDALERAIEAERAAGRQMGDDHPERPVCLANLAASLLVRHELSGATAELDEAASALTEAVAMSPADSPDLAMYLYNLGEAGARTFAARADRAAAAEAVAAFRAAAAVETAPPMIRAEAAMEWGRLSAKQGDWLAAAEGFGLAVGLFPLISPRHFDRDDQEHQLAVFAGLASDAAACVLAAGYPGPADLLRAVALLEQGRGVLLGHLLGTSADLTSVYAADPELAREFERLRDEVDSVGSGRLGTRPVMPGGIAVGLPERPDPTPRRRELLRRLDEVIEKIRALSGLTGFLREPTAGQLLAAGAAGPVVLVNISQYRCDAIIIADGGVQAVPLPGVTAAGVTEVTRRYLRLFNRLRQLDRLSERQERQQRQVAAALRDICGWLWDRVARPVLDLLGFTPRDRDWPRIWWCPTGSLALLPLHAAHRYDPERGLDTGVADRAVSSYAATLRTLTTLRERARVPADGASVLVVALAETPGLPSLPHVKREIAAIAAVLPPRLRVLRDHAATRAAVTADLGRHPWFHFAGHSHQDLLHPGRARLCLRDGGLEALAIAGLRLTGGELAYLSSCEGAVAGTEIPDEPLHLALAFQVAGYRNVIAALWSVADAGAPEVASRIYGRLNRRGWIDGDDAALALHEAVLELRSKYPPQVWAAYLHAGV